MKRLTSLIIALVAIHTAVYAQLYAPEIQVKQMEKQNNVGIGIDEPDTKLHIKSDQYKDFITLDRTENGYIEKKFLITPAFNPDNSNMDQLRFLADEDPIVSFDERGFTGIGTTNPRSKLHITENEYKRFIILDRRSNEKVENVFHITPSFDQDGNDQLRFVANDGSDNVLMVLEDTRNVGIGTEDPTARLHVVSTKTLGGKWAPENAAIAISDGSTNYLAIDNNEIYSNQMIYIGAKGDNIVRFRSITDEGHQDLITIRRDGHIDMNSGGIRLREGSVSLDQGDVELRREGSVRLDRGDVELVGGNIRLHDGDIFLNEPRSGIIMRSTSGACWRTIVTNEGQLRTERTGCPDLEN